ncbi:MAG: zinc dependent phospholipase C family protein [Chloroflexota bacterium]
MASWIVHLRIAENLLESIEGLDVPMFAIGNIAPDSGMPDEEWKNFDPPTEVTHFTAKNDETGFGIEDLRFYRDYLMGERMEDDRSKYSFQLGYFFHLVTDNYWREIIDKPTRERYENEFEADDEFIWEVKRDWYGLDFIYVRDHPNALFWRKFLKSEIQESFLDFLPIEAIHYRVNDIKEFYQRQDDKIQVLYERSYEYLSKEEMDQFVEDVSQALLEIYKYLTDGQQDFYEFSSVLEISLFET